MVMEEANALAAKMDEWMDGEGNEFMKALEEKVALEVKELTFLGAPLLQGGCLRCFLNYCYYFSS